MIVGGYALAYHGSPRYTGDINIFIKPDSFNTKRILAALDDFGFANLGIEPKDLQTSDKMIRLGKPPNRIDIMTSITGVSWEDAVSDRVEGNYGDIRVYYIGRDSFIANKRSTKRLKDLADIEALGESP